MGNSNGKAPLNSENVRKATEHYKTRKEGRKKPAQRFLGKDAKIQWEKL